MDENAPIVPLDYPALVREALRGVVRGALEHVVQHGLPAPHHLYLTFDTTVAGVQLPGFLRDAYPSSLTIVLENQFWDLEVDEEGFQVTLRFGGASHRIGVPFVALTAFVDPGVEFGLRFEGSDEPDTGDAEARENKLGEEGEDDSPSHEAQPAAVVQLDAFRRRRTPKSE